MLWVRGVFRCAPSGDGTTGENSPMYMGNHTLEKAKAWPVVPRDAPF